MVALVFFGTVGREWLRPVWLSRRLSSTFIVYRLAGGVPGLSENYSRGRVVTTFFHGHVHHNLMDATRIVVHVLAAGSIFRRKHNLLAVAIIAPLASQSCSRFTPSLNLLGSASERLLI